MNSYLDNEDLRLEIKNKEFLTPRLEIYEKALEILGGLSHRLSENAKQADLEHANGDYSKATKDSLRLLRQTGISGMTIPETYGGLDFPITVFMAALEIISKADAGLGAIWSLQACSDTILEFADEELKRKWLPLIAGGENCAMALTEPDAGSDLQSVRMKAVADPKVPGLWYLNGVKRYITGGNARMVLVLARSEAGSTDGRGLSLYVYDSKDGHVSLRRTENKLGIRSSVTLEMCFQNAPVRLVGDTRMGLIKYVMSLMNGARLAVAAQSVGIAEAAYCEAQSYALSRKQFGVQIATLPQVDMLLRGIKSRLMASRALLYETAKFVDLARINKDNRVESKRYRALADAFTPLVKFAASEFASKAASDSLQIHGGSGYMKESRVERLFRDARVTSIYEGTSQMQVVAAMTPLQRGVYSKQFASYEVNNQRLQNLLCSYDSIVSKALCSEHKDYVARNLVGMTAYVAMSLLLYVKYNRVVEDFVLEAEGYLASTEVFVNHFIK